MEGGISDEEDRQVKVNRLRSFTGAEEVVQDGKDRFAPRGAGEAGQKNQRPQNENDPRVGGFLEDVVSGRFLSFRMAKEERVPEGRSDFPEVAPTRKKIFEKMSAGEAVSDVGEPVERKDPGKEEMVPPTEEPLTAGVDLKAADDKNQETENINPMCQPNKKGVTKYHQFDI